MDAQPRVDALAADSAFAHYFHPVCNRTPGEKKSTVEDRFTSSLGQHKGYPGINPPHPDSPNPKIRPERRSENKRASPWAPPDGV